MADNVILNTGSGGATAATDDVGGIHFQRVKLVDGTLDSSAAIAGDATNGLDVDVTRVIPGTSATSLGKAEDAAHSSGDTGVMALSVRQDSAAALAGTDGDYQPLTTDASGLLRVNASGVAIPITDNSGSLTVDGTIAATQSGTWNVGTVTTLSTITNAVHVDDNAGSITVDAPVGTPAFVRLSDGSAAITTLPVSLASVPSHAVTNAGTFVTQENGGALTSLQLIDNVVVVEDVAHSSGDSGVMSLAVRRDADTSLVSTDGDYAPLQVNAAGSLKVAITAGAGSGGTSIADGASFTRDTTSITPAGAAVETSAPTLTNGDVAALSMTTGGALRVAVASGGVSGIVEDSASAGGEEGIMVLAVRRDVASSGVSTDGDFAALSVDSTGALRVAGSAGTTQYTEDAASAGAESLCLMGAVRRDTAASSSGTDGDYSTINVDANGRLHVIAAIAATQTLATVTTVSTVTAVTNVATIGTSVTPGTSAAHLGKAEDAAHASGDTGVFALAVRTDTAAASSGTTGDYEALHTDSVGALWSRSTGELADDSAFTPATSRVMPAGFTADETATDSVDEGDIGAARMTLDRKQIITPYAHAAAGGHTPYKNLDVDESEDDIKTSAGKLFWLHAMNLTAAVLYLKIYNSVAASVTVGTTVPDLTFPLPTMADTNGAGFAINFGDAGMQFTTGICIAATTGLADNNAGAPAANAVVVNAGFL